MPFFLANTGTLHDSIILVVVPFGVDHPQQLDLSRNNYNIDNQPNQHQALIMDLSFDMVTSIPSVISHHWKAGTINWPMSIYITLIHVVGLVGSMKFFDCKVETLLWAFILWPIR